MKFFTHHMIVLSLPSCMVFNLPHPIVLFAPASTIFFSPQPMKLDAPCMIFLYPPTIAPLLFEIQFSTHHPMNPMAHR